MYCHLYSLDNYNYELDEYMLLYYTHLIKTQIYIRIIYTGLHNNY